MYTTIRGVYKAGKIILKEAPPTLDNAEVIVTFLSELNDAETTTSGKRKLGFLKGQIAIPDDFNEPLEDLKDYM